MKTFYILLIIGVFLFSCKTEKVTDQDVSPKIDSTLTTVFNPPTLTDEYYRELFKYQQNIIFNPDSREQKEKYIFNAYFADNNTLISFGSGRRTNPNTQQTIALSLVKRAALVDAKRWATYGLLWLTNDFKPDFGRISEIHYGETKEIYSFYVGDSLVIALASKVR